MYDGERIWELDPEARVLAPLVVVLALVIFAIVGPWAVRGDRNRSARAGLVVAFLAILGVVAFWLSLPIVLGGLAITLGLEGLRRGDQGRQMEAKVAVAVGALAALAGATMWLTGV
jgi:hypothetical protein